MHTFVSLLWCCFCFAPSALALPSLPLSCLPQRLSFCAPRLPCPVSIAGTTPNALAYPALMSGYSHPRPDTHVLDFFTHCQVKHPYLAVWVKLWANYTELFAEGSGLPFQRAGKACLTFIARYIKMTNSQREFLSKKKTMMINPLLSTSIAASVFWAQIPDFVLLWKGQY